MLAPVDHAELELVRGFLRPEESRCWERLGTADRNESVVTVRATLRALGTDTEAWWVAAALLHDVGKAETDLGPVGRSWATVRAHSPDIAGPGGGTVESGDISTTTNWSGAPPRWPGARPETASWAAAHHRRGALAGNRIPPDICEILAAADGEPERR